LFMWNGFSLEKENMSRNKIRVAMVAPPFGDTGGPEIVVQNLVNELLSLDVDVTLFAPADWKTQAKLIPTLEQSIWNMSKLKSINPIIMRNLVVASQIEVLKYQDKFDIVHVHSQGNAYFVGKNLTIPCVLSLHNRFLEVVLEQLRTVGIYIVALSETQKGTSEVLAVIYNGVPTAEIRPSFKKGKYLMFVGRLADQKGADIAIRIALKAEKKLLIFGRVGKTDERKDYYQEKLKPYLNDENIIHMGDVSHEEIYDYLREAEALLFPIRRPEVCPLVVEEALACGTPVIGSRVNPLPEMLPNARTAFLSNDFDAMVEAAKNIDQFDRAECRQYAEENFDSSVMAKKYVELYKKIIRENKK